MKHWPAKILITSEEGFKKFEEDAKNYFACNGINEHVKHPDKFPCVVVGVEYTVEHDDGYSSWDETEIELRYVYLSDFDSKKGK